MFLFVYVMLLLLLVYLFGCCRRVEKTMGGVGVGGGGEH